MIDLRLGDCLDVMASLPSESVYCCVTSPPYFGLRDYGIEGQIGLEPTPDAYVARMVDVFREVWRVLRDDGTLWLNLGDSYASTSCGRFNGGSAAFKRPCRDGGHAKSGALDKAKASSLATKQLLGIPWRVAFALQADGWYLRSDIIWHKPNPMPESVRDRPTKAHEYLFLLSKSVTYHYDADAVREPMAEASAARYAYAFGGRKNERLTAEEANGPGTRTHPIGIRNATDGRNRRSVWTVATTPFKGAHFATFPPKLIEPCILAGCPVGESVLDPFSGAGTTGVVAAQHGRSYVGIELNSDYLAIAQKRIAAELARTALLDGVAS